MVSRTALLTVIDRESPKDASANNNNSFVRSMRGENRQDINRSVEDDYSRKVVKFALRVHQMCQPMRFMQNSEINEQRVMLYIKYCFNQSIHAFQYNHNTKHLEIMALKYITFMSAYK